MALPGSYQNSIHLKDLEEIVMQQFIDKFEVLLQNNDEVKEFSTSDESIQYTYHSLFSIPYQIEIYKNGIQSKTIIYEIKLNKLIVVCIALIIFIAFFSSFQFNGFLWFSGIFTLIFYAINVIVVDKYVQGILKLVLNYNVTDYENEDILSKQQMEWMRDNSKCPACGEDITEYDKNCPECGIKIREKARPKSYDLSKYENKNIKYFFKEKKKDNSN